MLKYLYTLLLSLFFYQVLGQTDSYEPAQITTNDGEILSGDIKWVSESQLSVSFEFLEHGNSDSRIFHPGDIKQILLTRDSIFFEPIIYKTDKENNPVLKLCKILCKGTISLYTFYLLQEDPYYYLANNQVFVARKNEKNYFLFDGITTSSALHYQYQRVLDYLTNDAAMNKKRVENINYNTHEIQQFILRYNTIKAPGEEMVPFHSQMKPVVTHQIRFSASYIPKFNYNFDFPLKSGKGFNIGYYLDITNPSVSKKLSSSFGLSYFYYKWESTFFERGNKRYIIEDPMRGISLSISGIYLFNSHRTTPFLSGGMIVEFSNFQPFLPFVNIGIGEKINRFRVSLSYAHPINFTFKGGSGILSLNIGYIFLQSKYH